MTTEGDPMTTEGDPMTTLTDLIAEALREHPDATDRSADDGCWCRTPGTAGRYDQHAAAIIAAVVADWLETPEAQGLVASALLGRTATVGAVLATSALAAEARKGVDQ